MASAASAKPLWMMSGPHRLHAEITETRWLSINIMWISNIADDLKKINHSTGHFESADQSFESILYVATVKTYSPLGG